MLPRGYTIPEITSDLCDISARLTREMALSRLLAETKKEEILNSLSAQGYHFESGFVGKELSEIQIRINEMLDQLRRGAEIRELYEIIEFEDEGIGEDINPLDERLTDCLEQLRGDFDRGIVLIDMEGTIKSFARALKANKTAGQTWETIEAHLLANNADLLRRAAALPGGPCLIGVYSDGTLAIRQSSLEIMNVRRDVEGQLCLLPHAEALALPNGGKWGKAVEIVQCVKAAGYHVPPDSPNHEKKGLIAAYEAVMGGNYVESPNRDKWRSAMLECPDETSDRADVGVVTFNPANKQADVRACIASGRAAVLGAILWLRG